MRESKEDDKQQNDQSDLRWSLIILKIPSKQVSLLVNSVMNDLSNFVNLPKFDRAAIFEMGATLGYAKCLINVFRFD